MLFSQSLSLIQSAEKNKESMRKLIENRFKQLIGPIRWSVFIFVLYLFDKYNLEC